MKQDTEAIDSKDLEINDTSRSGFIAKTLFAGAGLATSSLALAASQNQANAQTRKRKDDRANNKKDPANPSGEDG